MKDAYGIIKWIAVVFVIAYIFFGWGVSTFWPMATIFLICFVFVFVACLIGPHVSEYERKHGDRRSGTWTGSNYEVLVGPLIYLALIAMFVMIMLVLVSV